MRYPVKSLTLISVLFALPGLSLAHTEHSHGQSMFLSLWHPFTGSDHLLGLLLLGLMIHVVRRLESGPIWLGAACIVMLPALFSYTLSTAAIMSLNTAALALLFFLRELDSRPALRKI